VVAAGCHRRLFTCSTSFMNAYPTDLMTDSSPTWARPLPSSVNLHLHNSCYVQRGAMQPHTHNILSPIRKTYLGETGFGLIFALHATRHMSHGPRAANGFPAPWTRIFDLMGCTSSLRALPASLRVDFTPVGVEKESPYTNTNHALNFPNSIQPPPNGRCKLATTN
jgi:hypothetical protein